MEIIKLRKVMMVFGLLTILCFGGCQSAPTDSGKSAAAENKSLAPQKVDIRGSIIMSRYSEGQVMLEVEGSTSPDSRYNRAYVLVTPVTQIVDVDGQSISLSELRQGQNVAILLRGGGQGNFTGVGVARKLWVEDVY